MMVVFAVRGGPPKIYRVFIQLLYQKMYLFYTDRHAVSALWRSRSDRLGFSQLQNKKFSGREIQKMQKSGLAGRVSLWLANGGAGFASYLLFSTSHLFLSVGFC